MSDIFDFGFTAVNEDELAGVEISKRIAEEKQEEAATTQERLDKLYNSIMPLLTNLKANPDREYILWPNRVEKIEAFEKVLYSIYKE